MWVGVERGREEQHAPVRLVDVADEPSTEEYRQSRLRHVAASATAADAVADSQISAAAVARIVSVTGAQCAGAAGVRAATSGALRAGEGGERHAVDELCNETTLRR